MSLVFESRHLPLWSLALAGFAAMAAPAMADDYRIAAGSRPIEQSVWLKLDPAQDRYQGRVRIVLERTKAGDTLQFNGLDYTIDSAKLSGAADCALKATMGEHGVVTASCAHSLPVGRYQLEIAFNAPYNRQSVGLYKTEAQGTPYLFTQFEMSDARRAFPVFDEPGYKIPFQLTLEAPEGLKVYANTPETKQDSEQGWTRHEFAPTPPIPSYLVAFAAGPFEEVVVKGLGVPGRIITTRGKSGLAAYSAQEMPKILKALEAYFGRPYPYAKLDSVAVPEYPFGAMENAGLITYREDILLIDAEHASLEQKVTALKVMAHEIAHQWFGDLVTMRWWDDLWLNEAFASWMAAKIIDQQYPELETHIDLPQNGVMPVDALTTTKPIRKPIKTEADIMDGLGLAYNKGSAVLSLVEQWIGEDDFRRGIQAYLKAHEFSNAQADDLWSALGKAADQDVAAVLRAFIEQSSFPLLTVEVSGKTLSIAQERFSYPGANAAAQRWTVPVNIKYGDGERSRSTSLLLSEITTTLELEFAPRWVYPDTDAKGYYRFVLGDDLLERSLPYFTDKALNVRERRAFIAGSDALFQAGKLHAATYLRIVTPFLNDPHPRVVNSALGYLNELREPLVDAALEPAWARYIAEQTQPALKRFGLSSLDADAVGVDVLRNSLINLAGLEGRDAQVIAECRKQVERYLEDPDQADSRLIDAQLSVAAFYGDAALFERMVKVFETTTKPAVRSSVLAALSMFGEAKLQLAALDYLLTDKITASDVRYAFYGHLYKEARAARMRDWLYAHYDDVLKKLPPFVIPSMPQILGGGCETSVFKTAEAFFQPRLEDTPDYRRTLEKTAESVQQCVDLRAREAAGLSEFLQSVAKVKAE